MRQIVFQQWLNCNFSFNSGGGGSVDITTCKCRGCRSNRAHLQRGIADRVATFETRLRTPEDILSWFDGVHPVVVVEQGGAVVAFAATFAYRPRDCYAGIAEVSAYVARESRGKGAGKLALEALIEAAEVAGYWKILSRVFPENSASRRLIAKLGFREVGTYQKHGKLDGEWRDVVIVERLISVNLK
jgi:phosphinothricin acetyltransferase